MNKQLETAYHSIQEKINNINLNSVLDKFYSQAPIYAWRFGLGPIVGRYIMIITQINHKTGNPCKTSMEYFEINGIKYIANLFGVQSQWHRNIMANPRVSIQTCDGTEQMIAVPVSQDDELITIIEWLLNRNPKFIAHYMDEFGVQPTRKDILKHKNDLIFLRFDPTSEPTPRGLEVDLAWIWPILLIWTMLSKPKRRK
ncbi:MAG: nitroreductase family deazaflavin-dependent oxidoreductase [Anaerolineaceae bacterium]|nr:nitroreductase family deazaflavin-dependent oxidoreductase [Anaerolineaceae bacterium]